MKIFHCDHCQHLVFFENFQCVSCGHALAYIPEAADLQSLEPIDDKLWKRSGQDDGGQTYRLCENYVTHNVCNWAIPHDNSNTLCPSCRLTRVIPDLNQPGNQEAWYRLEIAKRRLIYTLLNLKLPLANKTDDPEHGLTFEFLSDVKATDLAEAEPVLTGHSDGVVIINIAEADDAEREKRRLLLHEPYRTLLGHFRHEVGHYYWDRLIPDSEFLNAFRTLFGDERADYAQALQNYYDHGAPADWQQHFVSAYSCSHPWEDWAETWAHYLHMVDTLETAYACGLSLRPGRKDEPALKTNPHQDLATVSTFDKLIDSWFPLTYVLNNLNRGLGLSDGYPFVLSPSAIQKLRFVHEVVTNGKQQSVEQQIGSG